MIAKKVSLTLICLCLFTISLVFIGQSSAVIDKKTVVGMWLLNDSGGNTAKDSSGNKNDGTLVGKPKWIDGKFGKALEFDGTSGVEIANPDNFDFLTWTYVFWFKAPAGGDYPNLIGRQFDNAHGWTFHLDPAGATFRIRIDSDGGINQLPTVPMNVRDDKWHHGAATQDDKANKVNLFIDGNKGEKTYLGKYKNSGGFLKIALAAVGAVNFNGAIDDVAIFNTILSDDDIKAIMDNGLESAVGLAAVSSPGKLASTWGSIKSIR